MGRMVEFPSNGQSCQGYLAEPDANGPGIVVIQEWWGLVPHIKDVAERLAAEGFVALAPDLYHGESTTEPDEAQKKMMALDLARAARDMSGSVSFLQSLERVEPKKVGSVGFCMGGALSLVLGTVAPVDAVVSYYGFPFREQPEWANLKSPVLGHFAEQDEFFAPAAADELFGRLRAQGTSAELHVYEGCDHAFFNDENVDGFKPEAAKQSWDRTLAFFRKHLR
jgi:carboxymethylenebutenolidase